MKDHLSELTKLSNSPTPLSPAPIVYYPTQSSTPDLAPHFPTDYRGIEQSRDFWRFAGGFACFVAIASIWFSMGAVQQINHLQTQNAQLQQQFRDLQNQMQGFQQGVIYAK